MLNFNKLLNLNFIKVMSLFFSRNFFLNQFKSLRFFNLFGFKFSVTVQINKARDIHCYLVKLIIFQINPTLKNPDSIGLRNLQNMPLLI